MKHAFKRLAVAIVALAMICGGAQAAVGAYVTQDNLPVFSAPYYMQETFLCTVNAGDALNVIAVQNGWAMVERYGCIGYTGAAYLAPATGSDSTAATQRTPGYVTTPTPLYAAPSFSSQQIVHLAWGTQVYVTAVQGYAARVENAEGTIAGYVPVACLSDTQPQRVAGYAVCDMPLYSAASFSAGQIMALPLGTAVYIIGTVDAFYCVQNAEGTVTGYVYAPLVSQTSPVTQCVPRYTACNTAVFQLPSLSSNCMALAAGTPLYLIGYSADGAFGCVQNVQGTIRGYIPLAHLTNTLVQPEQPEQQPSALEQLKAQVTMVDWYDTARYALERGAYYMLYDIRNGQTINIKYTTGSSHMDIEPATAEDTAKLKQALGGEWTYVRTPFILIANGCFAAASLYGEPHGGTDTIAGNNMDGVVCLHLTNSRTHGSNRVDEDHQAAILTAYNWAHS